MLLWSINSTTTHIISIDSLQKLSRFLSRFSRRKLSGNVTFSFVWFAFFQEQKYFGTEWFGFWNEFPENDSSAAALVQERCFQKLCHWHCLQLIFGQIATQWWRGWWCRHRGAMAMALLRQARSLQESKSATMLPPPLALFCSTESALTKRHCQCNAIPFQCKSSNHL